MAVPHAPQVQEFEIYAHLTTKLKRLKGEIKEPMCPFWRF